MANAYPMNRWISLDAQLMYSQSIFRQEKISMKKKESVLFLLDKAKNKTLNTSERGALETFKKRSDDIEDKEKRRCVIEKWIQKP